jgi:hypothetical protein
MFAGAAVASRVGCTPPEAKHASRGLRLMRLPSEWGMEEFGFNSCLFCGHSRLCFPCVVGFAVGGHAIR